MSRVDLTFPEPGETASSTDHNANAAAWNAATADVDQDNVRQDGLDHRNFADSVAESLTRVGSASLFESATPSASALVTYAATPVIMGGSPAQIGPSVPSADDDMLVRCSALVVADNTAALSDASFYLLYSTDNVTWNAIASTARPLKGPSNGIPGYMSYTVTHRNAITGTVYYALGFTSATETAHVENCVLDAQILAH